MRTTLTLDDDVSAALEREQQRSGKPFKQVVNDAIRRGLGPRQRVKVQAYVAPVFDAALVGGIDRGSLNRVADELEEESRAAQLADRS